MKELHSAVHAAINILSASGDAATELAIAYAKNMEYVTALEAKSDSAFATLSAYGVPKDRASTLSNGIDVLAIRFRKDIMALEEGIAALEQQITELRAENERLKRSLYWPQKPPRV